MLVIAEDSRFRTHHGIDFVEIREAIGAAWRERDWSRLRGASTITQQLAKNLYLSPSRNPLRKIKEAVTALRLELALPKDRIMELYLRVVEWGPGVWGAEAASEAYFGAPLSRLNDAQAAALRRMSVVASDQTHRIRLAFSGGIVKFSVQTPDLGEAQDELAVTYEGEPLEIGFNAMYLLEILKYMPTDEVRLTFKAPERASTVEPVGWNDPASYMALVMPLRLVD